MKLKCIQASYSETKGVFTKTTTITPISGLTENKVYSAQIVSDVDGNIGNGFGSVGTEIKALIYNDNGNWGTYQIELFIPVED